MYMPGFSSLNSQFNYVTQSLYHLLHTILTSPVNITIIHSFQKPVSSVAPTSVQVSSGKPSPIYQTSSTKIQPVQPQTVQTQSITVSSSNHVASNVVTSQPQIVRNTASGLSSSSGSFAGQNASSQSILLSPPQSASTPLSTPDVSGTDKSPKPALPPKPTIKVCSHCTLC